VGIARQIGKHGLWPAERALGLDHPFGSAQAFLQLAAQSWGGEFSLFLDSEGIAR
jgi:hypothetical protein